MTTMSIRSVKCKKCRSIYQRPVLFSVGFYGDEETDRRNQKLLADTDMPCPKCGGEDVRKTTALELILVIVGIKNMICYDEHHDK